MIGRLATMLTTWSQRWVPDAYVIAVLLTAIVFLLAVFIGGVTAAEAASAWGTGLWELLAFAMQMCLIMLAGYVLAQTKPVGALLERLAAMATSPTRAVLVVALFSMISALINWGLSISASAVCAKIVARKCRTADFRLLVACAYLGMSATWHAGLSASAPLLVATREHADKTGIPLIPVSETIFSSFNIVLTLIVLVVIAVLVPRLHPKPQDTVPLPETADIGHQPEVVPTESNSWSDAVERWPIISWAVVVLATSFLWQHFSSKPIGEAIDLNTVNLILLTAGVLLHWNPRSFLSACERGGSFLWGIVIQFPFYAGIYGIIKSTALQDKFADVFVRTSTAETFPVIVYWYSGIVNYFVPSGGSKWFIEAPYIMQAGAEHGVAAPLTVLAYAWGDMMTDAIQPFWAIPLLGLAGLKFRDIMGYLTLVFIVYAALVSVAFAFAPRFF